MESENGFTLIEILITIGIIGVLSSIAIMNSNTLYSNYRTRGAARQLYVDMQMARLKAIKESRTFAICFSPGNTGFTSYSIRNTPGADGILCTTDDPLVAPSTPTFPFYRKDVSLSVTYSTLTFDENFGGGSTSIEFRPNGTTTSDPAGIADNVTIKKGARTIKIRVTAGTGNVHIQ